MKKLEARDDPMMKWYFLLLGALVFTTPAATCDLETDPFEPVLVEGQCLRGTTEEVPRGRTSVPPDRNMQTHDPGRWHTKAGPEYPEEVCFLHVAIDPHSQPFSAGPLTQIPSACRPPYAGTLRSPVQPALFSAIS